MDDETIEELFLEGAARWSALRLERPVFVTHVQGLLAARDDDRPARLRAEDLFLACACAAGVTGAVAAFEREHGGDIEAGVRRFGADADARAELKQLVLTRLFGHPTEAKIAAYSGEAPLRYWVRLVATRVAISANREHRAGPQDLSDDAILCQMVDTKDPEQSAIKAQLLAVYRAAFAQAFDALDARDKTVLRLNIVDRMSIDDLARLLSVHRATAARRAAAAREKLVEGIRAAIEEQTKLSRDEIESALRLVESQLDASIDRVFGLAEGAPR